MAMLLARKATGPRVSNAPKRCVLLAGLLYRAIPAIRC